MFCDDLQYWTHSGQAPLYQSLFCQVLSKAALACVVSAAEGGGEIGMKAGVFRNLLRVGESPDQQNRFPCVP